MASKIATRLGYAAAAATGVAYFYPGDVHTAFVPADNTHMRTAGATMRFGFPEAHPIKFRSNHIVHYDNRLRGPAWVCEHISAQTLAQDSNTVDRPNRSECPFKEDQSIHPFFRSTAVDYKKSGFDRGHMAAAANHKQSQDAMCSTFFYSNMSPQVGKGFNRDAWACLEAYARRLVRSYKDIFVCSGPLFMPKKAADGKSYVSYEVIGPNNVAVPTHFFKIILCVPATGAPNIQSFIMPNAVIPPNVPLSNYLVPLEAVEKACGFQFFNQLPNKYGCIKRDNRGKLSSDLLANEVTS